MFRSEAKIYLFPTPCDMQCSFHRLSGYVKKCARVDPLRGGLFMFLSRSKDRVKVLFWKDDGFWLCYERNEAGAFRVSFKEGFEEITGVDLALLLSGMDLERIKFGKICRKGVFS